MLIRSPPGSRTALRVLRLAFSFASPLAAGAVSILLPPLKEAGVAFWQPLLLPFREIRTLRGSEREENVPVARF